MKTKITYSTGAKSGQTVEMDKELAEQLVSAGVATSVGDEDPALLEATSAITASLEKKFGELRDGLVKQLNVGIDRARITVTDLSDADPTGGFKNLGEFAQAVRRRDKRIGEIDARLVKMAARHKADGMDESVLADGGALVPTEYSGQLYRDVIEEDPLYARARKYPITNGNSIFVPVRSMTELGVTAASGGSLGSWLNADGVAITPQKPVYNRVQFTLNRWGTLLPVTDELLADNNVALGNYIFQEGAIALAYDLNQAFVNGTGSAQPLGLLNAPVLIEAPADQGQANFTISYSNLVNVKAQLWTTKPNSMADVVWIAHPDCEAQFEQLKDSAGRNLYYATGTIDQTPTQKLFGIPVVYSYHCAGVGSAGDVILADLSQYGIATKLGGQVEQAMSMHLYFDAAEVAYRIIYRIDGRPLRASPLGVPNSTKQRSPFVCIAQRGGGPAS